MGLEERLKAIEKQHPVGQRISIIAIGKPLEVAISEYEKEHNIKVDRNDKTNIFTEVVLI